MLQVKSFTAPLLVLSAFTSKHCDCVHPSRVNSNGRHNQACILIEHGKSRAVRNVRNAATYPKDGRTAQTTPSTPALTTLDTTA